uniref:Uncharacterized protein n=1 Tax=viral metagenome TaxID=1070528 RepID=A0A6H1ZDX4_9ZZZZ
MKKALERKKSQNLFYVKDGKKIDNNHSGLSGDCSGLSGDCTGLSGDCTGLRGDCTGLSGNCTGLSGNCFELSGDLNDCNLSYEEREKGININDLIKE